MSAKINTKHPTSRQDSFRVHPEDVREGRNSRMVPAANYPDVVKARAVSIAKHGQLQPVGVRREEDKSLTLVFGFTRRDAVKLLRDGFSAIDPDTGVETSFHDPQATLWVKVEDVGVDEAFVRSIAENLERKDTTDLQEALAQAELRTTMGWTDSKIARFYGYTNQNRVAALSKLLTLPKSVRQMVHDGRLALYAALDTLPLSDEERAQVLDGATGENGKIQGATLRELIRKLYETGEDEPEAEEEPDDRKPSLKRNVKDLQRFRDACEDVAACELLDVMLLWFKGTRTDEYLARTLQEYIR